MRPITLRAGIALQGRLDRGALRATLDAIVARHEALRTSFVVLDSQPVQRIAAAEVGFHLIEHDLSGLPAAAQRPRVNELSGSEAAERFDLSAGPLIRGQLLRLGPEEHLLLITQHHIISDGWSTVYWCGKWQRSMAPSVKVEPNPCRRCPFSMPTTRCGNGSGCKPRCCKSRWSSGSLIWQEPRGCWSCRMTGRALRVQSYAGGRVGLALSGQLTAGLRRLSRRHGVTLFMTLLAGWSALLSRLSGQSDVVIGTPVANRPRSELEPLMGFFANTLALRVRLEDDPSVAELLRQIKTTTLEAYAHQDLPFAQVVEALQPPRSLSYNPIFQVVLAFDNAPGERVLSLPGLKVSEFENPSTPREV